MAKALVMKVRIPGLGVSHEFLVPDEMPIRRVLHLLLRILHNEYPDAKCHDASTAGLLQASTGLALDKECTLEQLGIDDGDTFILL